MHIYFSGIGGTGIGPLALIAKQAGYEVSGSDKQDSEYINYLKKLGISKIYTGDQTYEQIENVHNKHPIDWFVYTTAVTSENSNPPEIKFCQDNKIRISVRNELLNTILSEKNLEMIAIAGTHGKSTTTAMAIWLLQHFNVPESHSVGAKMSFAEMGHYEPGSKYFVYEADEYARNFLQFKPKLSLITGIDWDHPDIYPTRDDYYLAFSNFIGQSQKVVAWQNDLEATRISVRPTDQSIKKIDPLLSLSTLVGEVNRQDALLVAYGLSEIIGDEPKNLILALNSFPGLSRRFEQLAPNLFTDYAHTPPKIRGTLETAQEVAGNKVVVVYEGLHNTRQHFIKNDLKNLFNNVSKLYIVPSYLAREDQNLSLLSPSDLKSLLSLESQEKTVSSKLDANLWQSIEKHRKNGDLVLCISAGGGGSLDEWLRNQI